MFEREPDFDSSSASTNYTLPKAEPFASEYLQFKRLYFAFLESISLPFLSDMRLLIVSFRSAPSCSECCLFLAPIYSVLTRVLPFAKHVKLSSLTSSSADSDSYLATQQIHCLEWSFTLTWLQLRQARLLFPIAVCSATH